MHFSDTFLFHLIKFVVKSQGLPCSWNISEYVLTSSVSDPPTMLRPNPVRPLEISIVVSQPGIMGQVARSEAKIAGVDDLLVPKRSFECKET